MSQKNIVITGATGLIGQSLCAALTKIGHDVTVFTRDVKKGRKFLPYIDNFVELNYRRPELWADELNGKDAIIHLAGANVFGKRWSDNYKSTIMESRKIATRNMVNACANLSVKPGVFITSSAVGFYGDRSDQLLTEESPSGNDFLANVCKVWENESSQIDRLGIRRVNIRTGIVLSLDDGALKKMIVPFKLFLGGPLGNGKQWFPWIHIEDLVNIYLFTLNNTNISGPVNAVSPNPVTMNEFAKTLGNILHRPSIFKVPEFVLKLAVGQGAQTILASQRVIPQKLIAHSFEFKYINLQKALNSLLGS